MKSRNTSSRNKRASALGLVMIFTAVMGVMATASLTMMSFNTRMVHRTRVANNSMSGARVVMDSMFTDIRHIVNNRPPQIEGQISQIPLEIANVSPSAPDGYRLVQYPGEPVSSSRKLAYVFPNDDEFAFTEITDAGDPWFGYATARLDYNLVSVVVEESNRAETLSYPGAGLSQRLVIDYIPLYQFAIFYEPELEFHPGPRMDVRGRVHSNGPIKWASGGGLSFHERVAAVGDLTRFVSNDHNNYVRAQDSEGDFVDYRGGDEANGDGWLTADDDNWLAESFERWDGNVRDSSYGVLPIRPPLPPGETALSMIQRAQPDDPPEIENIRMENLAELIVEGSPADPSTIRAYHQTVDAFGNRTLTEVPTTFVDSDGDTVSWVDTGIFFDGREHTVVRTLDIDMGLLIESNVINFANGSGIIYASTTPVAAAGDTWTVPHDPTGGFGTAGWTSTGVDNYMPAVRVTNATDLPDNVSGGFGFYTDRPLYTAGDINTVDRAIAVFSGDNVTVTTQELTLNYTDSDGVSHSGNTTEGVVARTPTSATSLNTNVIFMMGNVPSEYDANGNRIANSGGSHNVMRYLENLGGSRPHNFSGSILVLFESDVALGPMNCCPHYSPPRRNYDWDSSLQTATPPPGMPLLLEFTPYPMDRISVDAAATLYDVYEAQ